MTLRREARPRTGVSIAAGKVGPEGAPSDNHKLNRRGGPLFLICACLFG